MHFYTNYLFEIKSNLPVWNHLLQFLYFFPSISKLVSFSSLHSPSLFLFLLLPRCLKASQSVSRQISAFIWTGLCCRTVKLLKGPLRAACGRWPWSSKPPTHPLETRWSMQEMCSLLCTSYPVDQLKYWEAT